MKWLVGVFGIAFCVTPPTSGPAVWGRVKQRSYTAAKVPIAHGRASVQGTGWAQEGDATMYRCGKYCGCNLLYLYAIAHKVSLGYGRVREVMSAGNPFATLQDIERGARVVGVNACIRRISLSDLELLDLPVLVHIDAWNAGPSAAGEFILVIDRDGSTLKVIDGVTCVPSIMSVDEFTKRWAGFTMMGCPKCRWDLAALGLALIVVVRLVKGRIVHSKPILAEPV